MDFTDATDQLTARITHQHLADALGVDIQSVRQARLSDHSAGRRAPPVGWQPAVAQMARDRAAELLALADKLDETRA